MHTRRCSTLVSDGISTGDALPELEGGRNADGSLVSGQSLSSFLDAVGIKNSCSANKRRSIEEGLRGASSLSSTLEVLSGRTDVSVDTVDAVLRHTYRLASGPLPGSATALASCLQELVVGHLSTEPEALSCLSNGMFLMWVKILSRLRILSGRVLSLSDSRLWLQLGSWSGKEFIDLLRTFCACPTWQPAHQCLDILASELAERMRSDGLTTGDAAWGMFLLVVRKHYYTQELIDAGREFIARHEKRLSPPEISRFSPVFQYCHDSAAFDVLNRAMVRKIPFMDSHQAGLVVSCASHVENCSVEQLEAMARYAEEVWPQFDLYTLAEMAQAIDRKARHLTDAMQRIVDALAGKIQVKPSSRSDKALQMALHAVLSFPGIRTGHFCQAATTYLSHCHLTAGFAVSAYLMAKANQLKPALARIACDRLLTSPLDTDIDAKHLALLLHATDSNWQVLRRWAEYFSKHVSQIPPTELKYVVACYAHLPENTPEKSRFLSAAAQCLLHELYAAGFESVAPYAFQLSRTNTGADLLRPAFVQLVSSKDCLSEVQASSLGLFLLTMDRLKVLSEQLCSVAVDNYCREMATLSRKNHIDFLCVLGKVRECPAALLDEVFHNMCPHLGLLESDELVQVLKAGSLRSAVLGPWLQFLQGQLRMGLSELPLAVPVTLVQILSKVRRDVLDIDLLDAIAAVLASKANQLSGWQAAMCLASLSLMGRGDHAALVLRLEALSRQGEFHWRPGMDGLLFVKMLHACTQHKPPTPHLYRRLLEIADNSRGSFNARVATMLKSSYEVLRLCAASHPVPEASPRSACTTQSRARTHIHVPGHKVYIEHS